MNISDDLLVEKLHSGDIKAFEWIYNHYYELLCRYAYRFLKDRNSAEEIVDDVMCSLWARHERVEIRQIRAYLLHAVRNLCLNHLKSIMCCFQSSNGNISPEENTAFLDALFCDDEHPLGILLEKEFEKELCKAVDGLPKECRKVFEMSRRDNKKYGEISKELGISINTVKYHIKNALRLINLSVAKYLFIVLFAIVLCGI